MIVFLLLLIVAILLFGSSVVLGAIGRIFGAIALIIALTVGWSIAEQIPSWLWWGLGIVFGGGVVALFAAHERQQSELRRMIDELDPAARAAYEKNKRDSEAWSKRYEQGRKSGAYRR